MREVNKESEVMDGEAFTPRNMVLQRTGNESNDNWTLAEMKPFAASVRTDLCTTPPTALVWLPCPGMPTDPGEPMALSTTVSVAAKNASSCPEKRLLQFRQWRRRLDLWHAAPKGGCGRCLIRPQIRRNAPETLALFTISNNPWRQLF